MLNYHLTLFDVKKNTIIFKIEILLYFSNLHKFILYLLYIYICYNWTIINTIKSFIYLHLIKSVRQSVFNKIWIFTSPIPGYFGRRYKRNGRTQTIVAENVVVAREHAPNFSAGAIEADRRQRPPPYSSCIFL